MAQLRSGELELVYALLEYGRTTEAATFLGTDQSTISRRLAQLERRLGVELFVRARTGMSPTPLAERLRSSAQHVVSSLRVADQLLDEAVRAPSGRVRIACPEGLAQFVLAPRLGAFLREHPQLTVTLLDGPELINLAAAEAHLALRVVRPTSGDVVSKLLVTDVLAPFGAKRYVRGRDASALRWLGWDERFARFGEAKALQALIGREPDLCFTRFTTMIAAAKAGVGVMLVGRELGQLLNLEEAGFGGLPRMETKLWLAAPRALRTTPAVAATWSWIERGLEPAG